MKKSILTIAILCSFTQLIAQYPKLVIQFKDKGNNTFSLANPSQYLSPKAIARRTRFSLAMDSTDLPITQRYIDSVKLAGNVVILSQSKWLNQVLIQTTDDAALNKINSFSFVKSATGVGFRLNENKIKNKFKETISPLAITEMPLRTTADVYNYGNSYQQVHLHEGEFLHNKGYRGENIQVAVLDAGFLQYKTITAFDSIRKNNQVLGERDFVAFDKSVNEDDSHGMYCLSTMAANWPGKMVGTAPKASYWLVRTENASSEYPIEEHNWVVGAEFADSTGADMISSSLGYTDFDDPQFNHSYSDFYKNSTTVTKGATLAAHKGMIVMNSAGNDGQSGWKYLGFPADADSVCAVGAVNALGQIAAFSSFGYLGKVKPNIVSVGAGTVIAGFNNEPVTGNGTSFSNPNIAGLIACLWQAFPNFNNMKILDAVYKSSNRYTTPTDRYGFGIPNFRKAYQLLKKDQNIALYGNEWVWANPNPFTSAIEVRVIGQLDGNAKLELFGPVNQLIASINLTTEIEEVYTDTFTNLGSLPAGSYTIKYTDNSKTRSIILQKGFSFTNSWLVAAPNPFRNDLTVSLKAPETGKAALHLIDAKGSKIDQLSIDCIEGQVQTFIFKSPAKLQRGIYFIQYISNNQKRIVKLVKQ
jgi:subtilisin family serine protease